MLSKFVMLFIDDVLVYSKSKGGHAEYLRIVLEILRRERIYGNMSKYEFWLENILFLRQRVLGDEISMDPSKISAVKNGPF